MATSILDRYGIKEVADFTFYHINASGKPDYPVLYLDTLKVSTIEQTADVVDAKGGKGNATLLSWDTNKEIIVTLEDALFSAKSLAIMFGNGKVQAYEGTNAYIMRTETFAAEGTVSGTTVVDQAKALGWSDKYVGPDGKTYSKVNAKFYDANGLYVVASTPETGKSVVFASGVKYLCTFDILVNGSVIEVGASTFPGTYYCVGDTYARNENSGEDEFFQFIIPKAKVQSGNTITLQAEGDPSTFSMTLKVMRPADGVMMKLVKYNAENGSDAADGSLKMVHNHELNPETALVK